MNESLQHSYSNFLNDFFEKSGIEITNNDPYKTFALEIMKQAQSCFLICPDKIEKSQCILYSYCDSYYNNIKLPNLEEVSIYGTFLMSYCLRGFCPKSYFSYSIDMEAYKRNLAQIICKSEKRVVLYFCGHGTDTGLCFTDDSELKYSDLFEFIGSLLKDNEKRVYFFIDSCFSANSFKYASDRISVIASSEFESLMSPNCESGLFSELASKHIEERKDLGELVSTINSNMPDVPYYYPNMLDDGHNSISMNLLRYSIKANEIKSKGQKQESSTNNPNQPLPYKLREGLFETFFDDEWNEQRMKQESSSSTPPSKVSVFFNSSIFYLFVLFLACFLYIYITMFYPGITIK